MISEPTSAKRERLQQSLKRLGSVAVAFSGGVDSTFLLHEAHRALADKVLSITAVSPLFPADETAEALNFVETAGIRHIFCEPDVFGIEGFAENPVNRCYLCKKTLFTQFKKTAVENGFEYLAEGSNVDDETDYRPGMLAIKELSILSPLREARLTKEEIRKLSREAGLPTSEKPALACLASRFPYGKTITREKLKAVEISERLLFNMGFKQARVRYHDDLARIEVAPDEMLKLMNPEVRETVYREIRNAGFTYVSVDLKGYRMGSMNETIGK